MLLVNGTVRYHQESIAKFLHLSYPLQNPWLCNIVALVVSSEAAIAEPSHQSLCLATKPLIISSVYGTPNEQYFSLGVQARISNSRYAKP